MERSCLTLPNLPSCLALLPSLALLLLLPGSSLARVSNEEVSEVSQAVAQLTQRFATLEVSLQSRLTRLEDTAAKGEAVMGALAERLDSVDSLVEKVEDLEARLTAETSTIHSTAADTSTHLQGMAARLEGLESLVRGVGLGRHDIRSPVAHISGSDARLTALVRDSVREAVDRTLDHTLTTFHNTLYKQLSKSVGELQKAVAEARVGLEELGTRTLETATGTRQDIQDGGKSTQDAVLDIHNKIHSVHQDLSLKITLVTTLLHTLEPVLQQVNHSVVESITRATQNINVTSLLDQAVRRREGGGGGGAVGTGRVHHHHHTQLQDPHTQHCPDPTTVAALLEVKQLLQTLLKKSEDLRRSLTKQTNHGLDLLTLLQQRISVIMRRMNTEPDHSQMLVSEMQDLGSLVESSYMAVLVAQNAFIDSCKRIQDEEPMLELKMTEILDKLVTNIDLGYQHNHQQLTELKEVVQRMAERTTAYTLPSPHNNGDDEVIEDEGYDRARPRPTQRTTQAREVIEEAVERTNSTVEGLEAVEARVDQLSTHLLTTDWSDLREKEPADSLVTAAKDLKRYAQEQILKALDLHEALLEALEHLDSTTTTTAPTTNTTALPHVRLSTDASATLTLPPSCTAALFTQFQGLVDARNSPSTPHTPPLHENEEEGEQEEVEVVPAWYTDPDFLSGNYGTPDLGFPVFREDEWVYMDEMEDPTTQSPSITTSTVTQDARSQPASTLTQTHSSTSSQTRTHLPQSNSQPSTHSYSQSTLHHSQTQASTPSDGHPYVSTLSLSSQNNPNPPTSTQGLSTTTPSIPRRVDRFFGFMDRSSSSRRRS